MKRVLLKISGEAFLGKVPFGLSHEATLNVATKISELKKKSYEVALVIGGGNFFRGIKQTAKLEMERNLADQIGMLATLINGIALKDAFAKIDCRLRLISALDCPQIAEAYQWNRVMDYLKNGEVVLFTCGTGHPFFTTDTNAALRACEIHADILLKATTQVDGVYDKDPLLHPEAKPYTTISFQEVLQKQLGIMDLSAITMCAQEKIPIRVFNFYKVSLLDALSDKSFGTLINE